VRCSKYWVPPETRINEFVYPRSVAEFSPGKSFVPACPRSVTESSLGDGKFFFSTTTYGGAYVVVVLFVRGQ